MDLATTIWTTETYQTFLTELEQAGDATLREHMARLVPTDYPIWGLKMPQLRALGTTISRGDPVGFLRVAGAESYEAVIVQGFVLSRMKIGCAAFTRYCDTYLTRVDCWAMCDLVVHCQQVPKFKPAFLPTIQRYLQATNPWIQRTGLVFLLKFYLTPADTAQTLQLAASVDSDDYYVQMGQAWLLKAAFPENQAAVYQLLRAVLPLPVVQKTVAKIKGLRHTSLTEQAELQAILAERRLAQKRG